MVRNNGYKEDKVAALQAIGLTAALRYAERKLQFSSVPILVWDDAVV